MARGVKWFLGALAGLLIVLIVLFVLVRFQDGPMEIISGGPFRSGELVTGIEDWSFLSDVVTIELQTMRPPRSRLMWLVVHDNRPYVLSHYMNTHIGRVWKRWPRRLAKDNRAIVRVDGKLYEFQLIRLFEEEQLPAVLKQFNDKYKIDLTLEGINNENTWLFELAPR